MRAEVVKLVDAVDSKSTGLCAHAGSIPAFGTTYLKEQFGKFATMRYSMIREGNSVLPVFSQVLTEREYLPCLRRDVLAALTTILVLTQNPWRYRCPSDILQ